MASIRVSLDLGVFNMLSESDKPISLKDLATRTSADPVLLGRYLQKSRCLELTIQQADFSVTKRLLVISKRPAKMSLLHATQRETCQSRRYKQVCTLGGLNFSIEWRSH
jgi:hypothetical protein